jgi:hypothetical protein
MNVDEPGFEHRNFAVVDDANVSSPVVRSSRTE